jgi:hypothetical protein
VHDVVGEQPKRHVVAGGVLSASPCGLVKSVRYG